MTWTAVLDTLGLALLLVGSLLNLTTAIGLMRLRDTFSRQHAASKPQTLGVLLVLFGIALRLRTGLDLGMLLLVGMFQLLTIPVSAHLLTRAAYRSYVSPRRAADRSDGRTPSPRDRA